MFKAIFRTLHSPAIRTTSKKVIVKGVFYPIKIQSGPRNAATFVGDTLHVALNPQTRENFTTYLDSWYRRKARMEFHRAMTKWLPEFQRLEYDFPTPQLKIYKMTRAWGRCYYTKAVITLNIKLFRMPQECIDYILLHELTHMVAHDHGPLFLGILDKIDPDWRKKEAILRKLEQRKEMLL